MAYEILMPQLSDSMDEGKLISWKVEVNERVHIGDVIAEVESDKAIMEVQCFKNGIIEALYIKEGESAPVGTIIAAVHIENEVQVKEDKEPEKSVEVEAAKEPRDVEAEYSLKRALASPKARILAKRYNLDIHSLQEQKKLPSLAHEKDLLLYHQNRFFTLKALKLMELYRLSAKEFELSKKHDSHDVLDYIKRENIALLKEIPNFQKALIKNLDKSALRAVYHIYDYINSSYFEKYSSYGISAWLIKICAKAMMEFEGFRSGIKDEYLFTSGNASISLAMQAEKRLYMPVVKDANLLDIRSIQERLLMYKTKVENSSLSLNEMQGSSFGISNLGMTGIHRFDAMINQEDSAIAAIGASQDGRISLTLSIDHRLINGYEAALFMQRIKELCLDEEFFKETEAEVQNV